MRLVMHFNLNKPEIPIDYRPIFVSFIKKCLSQNSENLFEQYYSKQIPRPKAMSFAVKFQNPVFEKNRIVLDGTQILMTMTVFDQCEGILIYNAFTKSMGNTLPLADYNELKLNSVEVLQDNPVNNNMVIVKFLSPLVVRVHALDNIDQYLTMNDEGFQKHLTEVVKRQVISLANGSCTEQGFEFQPIKVKSTVVKSFGSIFEASLGIFNLCGRSELINFLYRSGIGSRRSEGFGMFDIIG